MIIKNKNWFTLLELVVVVSMIIIVFMFAAKSNIGWSILPSLMKQSAKDFIVTIVDETRQYSYNNITLSQELLKEQEVDKTNVNISRFNWQKAKSNNDPSKVAYYHWLYFTTDYGDPIDSFDIYPNKNIYLLQYKQEWFLNLNNRVYESFNIDYNTSWQLLDFDWIKYSKKYQFPWSKKIYLNRIIKREDWYWLDLKNTCNDYTSWVDIQKTYILFSIANMNYRFYANNILDPTYDYIFCYSDDPVEFNEKTWFGFRINRDRLEEYSMESIRNY